MSTAPPEPPRPVARWKLVLGLLVLVSVGLVGWLYIRGTWADATPRNPSSAAEGPVAQLYRPAGENVRVRGAILLDHPIDRVWKEVSDVARLGAPFMREVHVEDRGATTRVTGEARGVIIRWWPYEMNITTTDTPEKKELTWDGPAAEVVLVNRGSYVLTPDGPSRTLLVISEEAEIRQYPDFLVRATLLGRLKTVLRTIQERLEAGS